MDEEHAEIWALQRWTGGNDLHWSCFLMCPQVSIGLMGCWSWAWAIHRSWAVGRASTRWSWRSRKPSYASWQPFWRATVLSCDLSLRHPLRKPQMLARFLTCKVREIMSVRPLLSKTQELSIHLQLSELDNKVTEETGWRDQSSCCCSQQSPQTPLHWNDIKSTIDFNYMSRFFFFLWKKWFRMISTKVFTWSQVVLWFPVSTPVIRKTKSSWATVDF